MFGQISWFKADSKYLYVKLKVLKKHYNSHFRLAQKITTGETDMKLGMRLKK